MRSSMDMVIMHVCASSVACNVRVSVVCHERMLACQVCVTRVSRVARLPRLGEDERFKCALLRLQRGAILLLLHTWIQTHRLASLQTKSSSPLTAERHLYSCTRKCLRPTNWPRGSPCKRGKCSRGKMHTHVRVCVLVCMHVCVQVPAPPRKYLNRVAQHQKVDEQRRRPRHGRRVCQLVGL